MSNRLRVASTLSPTQQAELLLRLAGARKPASDPLLPPDPVPEADLPLSGAQEGIWFGEQLAPGSTAYLIASGLRLQGTLHVPLLQRSLQRIFARQAALRTTFPLRGDHPVQQINPVSFLPFEMTDLSAGPPGARTEALARLFAAEARRPLDLAVGPLFRAQLARLAEDEHVLCFFIHHLIFDGWSMGVLLRELAACYNAELAGQPATLPALPWQYAEYTRWQHEQLRGAALEGHLHFWRAHLAGAPGTLDLPTDHPRPPVQDTRGGRCPLVLPAELGDRLRAFCRATQVTPFMLLLATYVALLWRYSGQVDMVVGTPVANRSRQELEPLLGCFITTLALRIDVSGNPTLLELLQRIKHVTLEAATHQELPFERVVAELAPVREMSQHPLFQVMFTLQPPQPTPPSFTGLTVSFLSPSGEQAKFDLSLNLEEVAGQFSGVVDYRTALFEAATIKRLTGHYLTLLTEGLNAPGRPMGDLPLLTEPEREQCLVTWNATDPIAPSEACLQDLIERQVAETPDAIAVSDDSERLTYREINARANQLAHRLRALGVGREVLVGLCLERSSALVVGLLGILKAGGAYLPLDPTYPAERLAYMLSDSEVRFLVTEAHLADPLRHSAPHAQLVCLDAERRELAEQDETNPLKQATPADLAYVLYTSGSTGRPKGVQILQRALVNFMESMRRIPGMTPDDVLLAITTPSFDIAALELLLPLVVGAQVVIASRETAMDGQALGKLLAECQATMMQATPSTWRMLLASGWTGSPRLRALCGGEALSRELASQLRPLVAALWNLYGPTETTIWSTVSKIAGDERITIGRPIARTEVYILDEQMQPVPVGIPGELYIGGVGLARGYLNRPELTAARFVLHPFSQAKEARLYKTGDRARYLSDGRIECLGRLDNQVKVRGFRIEPGEIETLLRQQALVAEAVVVAHEDAPGEKTLVAYVVPLPGQEHSAKPLREALKAHLPEYMVPSRFLFLERLPLTPNGKVDRRALPPLKEAEMRADSPPVAAPRTALEKRLVALWAEVLQLADANLGINENFFDLGGHSLLAVELISRVRAAFSCDLPLRLLFANPTVEAFAQALEAVQSTPVEDNRPPPGDPPARGKPLASAQAPSFEPQERRHHPDLWKFWVGETISSFGGAFTLFALPLLVYRLTGSPLNLALSTAANFLPQLVFGLVIGAVGDRVNRKRLMILADLLNALVIGSLPVLWTLGVLADRASLVAWIYGVGFVSATLTICFSSGQFAVLPSLVPKAQLARANGRLQASFQVAQAVGPLAAGALLLVVPLPLLLVVDAFSFLVSAIMLAWIRVSFNQQRERRPTSLGQDVMAGLGYVWRHPVLRNIAVMMALLNLLNTTTTTQLVLFAEQRLGATPAEVSFLFTAGSLGMVVSGLLAGPLRQRWPWSKVALGAAALGGGVTVVLALLPWYALVAPLWGLVVGLRLLFNVMTNSLRQSFVPNELLSRVASVASVLAWSAIPLGAFLGGLAIEWTGNVALVYGSIGALTMLIVGGFAAWTALGHADDFLQEAGRIGVAQTGAVPGVLHDKRHAAGTSLEPPAGRARTTSRRWRFLRRVVPSLLLLLLLLLLIWTNSSRPLQSPRVSEFALPAMSGPQYLVAGPDALWISESFQHKLARITQEGDITEFPLPPEATIGQLAASPDGVLWFTEQGSNKMGRLSPDGSLTEFPLPPVSSSARGLSPLYRGLVVGPEGVLWVTDSTNGVVRRLTTSGAATNFQVEAPLGPPDQLVLATGALWISSLVNPTVSRLTPQGTLTAYPLALTRLGPLIAGPRGTVWFTDRSQPFVGFLAPGGMIQEFSLPPLQTGCLALAAGPDDAIWCALGQRLARISEAGELSLTELPTGVEAQELATGPDGNLWFLDRYHARVGRLLIGQHN